ncbi:hypothetical protein RND81_13G214600 [Saponaria officinalis]|uniref:DUF632 domain-containing protein n=1 Tax=Saponaria officinalis TaxID=3572 RepID=A0AAW1H4X3_SAPOF
MGSCVSKIERQEMGSRCRTRKRYVKHLLHSRHSLSLSLSFYLRSLRSSGAALHLFSTAESALHHHLHHPPPPAPMSPSADTWTSTPTPPPPTPPETAATVGGGCTWDYWEMFVPASEQRCGWEEGGGGGGGVSPVVGGEKAVVVAARQGKELVEIMKELEEYFMRAADAADVVSGILEISSFSSSSHHLLSSSGRRSINWGGNGKLSGLGFRKFGEECGMVVGKMGVINDVNEGVNNVINGNVVRVSHCATLERLYAWEKKLYHEVKNGEKLKMEHEKIVEQLRRMEVKRADYIKTEKTKKEVEKLESLLEVASQAIQTTSDEIIKLRESQLYPQLLLLIQGFTCMWRSMYECHQVQTHIVDQLKFLNAIPSNEPTSEIHRQTTLQLEAELQQWHQSFTNLVKAQRDYIHSLTGWLRLSLFQFNKNPFIRSIQDSTIYSLCEKWQLEIDHAPDKVASEGIHSLLTVVHAIVVQQAEEHKQKKRSENANKALEKRAAELRSVEGKYGPYSLPDRSGTRQGKNPVSEKRAKVDVLKAKAEEEKAKHEKAVGVTRAMTLNNLQTGLPHVFQAITGFSNVCTQGFEKVYNQAKNMDQEHDVKRLMA